jgi:hypothetical protein
MAAEHKTTVTESGRTARRAVVMLAEFDSTKDCVHAAEQLRDGGYSRFDAHTPFPVHGMDRAMGMKPSILGWIVLAMGVTGLLTAITMMMWMNGIDYPIVIGGKPPYSFPSMVPICFELTVLFSSFGAVFGMLGLNKLPRHHHPVFESDRFRAATDNKFFLSVESIDPKYDAVKTRALFEAAHASHIETIEEEVA